MGDCRSIENEILSAIRRIMRAVGLHSQRLVDECGLTGPQLAALKEAERLKEASVGTIARALHLSLPTVTGILGRLEKLGLVHRARGVHDRRRVMVRVTRKGLDKLDQAPSQLHERFRKELSALDAYERTMILAVLQRIASMMDAETLEAAPLLFDGESLQAQVAHP
jgi:DNA-binding MarR family transcriptional regulator